MASPTAIEIARTTREQLLVLDSSFQQHTTKFNELELVKLRETVAELRTRVDRLEKTRDEADRHGKQLLYIAVGLLLSLPGGVVVALVQSVLKK